MIGFYVFMTGIFVVCGAGVAILIWAIYCGLRILHRNAFPKETK